MITFEMTLNDFLELHSKDRKIWTNSHLPNKFGIQCISSGTIISSAYKYKVIDESKFALFMFTYPEYIKNLVYE